MLELIEIKARIAAAAEGPWAQVLGHGGQVYGPIVMVDRDADGDPYEDRGHIATAGVEDADLIARARTDLPALVAEVELLRGVVLAVSGVVERSDHADTCGLELSPGQGYPCSCWKADASVALAGA